jgi:hypothetical protein
MMVLVLLLVLVELVIYFVLLSRLSGLVRARKPELFAAAGGVLSVCPASGFAVFEAGFCAISRLLFESVSSDFPFSPGLSRPPRPNPVSRGALERSRADGILTPAASWSKRCRPVGLIGAGSTP